MTALWVAIVVASSGILGPLVLARYLKHQKDIDRAREDAVAKEALRQQEEVAETAERAAKLLLQSNKDTAAGTAEVAKQLRGEAHAAAAAFGVPVVISYVETGQREEVLLSNVPRIGERVRLKNGMSAPSLIVEDVVWMEAFLPPPNPSVIIVVREQSAAERTASLEQRREQS